LSSKHDRHRGCYLLHARPYRETSLLVRIFHREDGVIGAIAKGAATSRGLQPFHPFSARITGRSELKTLVAPEADASPWLLSDAVCLAGLYANELVLASCAEQDGHPRLFDAYEQFLARLVDDGSSVAQQVALRRFERVLFSEIGYELNYRADAQDQAISPGNHYRLGDDWMFVPTPQGPYPGSSLLAMAADDYSGAETQQSARALSRDLLKRMLGKPLNSWKIFA